MSRENSDDRVRRLLSIVPWVASRPDGVPVGELCERFGLDRKRLVSDLTTLTYVGVWPFTPDAQVEVVIENDTVWVRLPQWFDRPVRLTPDQGLVLVAAGQSLLSIPGADAQGPLARGLAKIAATLGIDADESLDVDLGRVDADVMAAITQGIDEHRRVDITYYSYGRDERSERVIDPWRLFADHGQWYLTAHCRVADGDRVFRVDRIERATLLDEHFEPPTEPLTLGVFEPAADDPRVVVELAPAAAWVVDQYPVEAVEALPDGRQRVTIAVAATSWLDRLLLRLGPDAVVVDAPPALRARAADAAAAVLRRYADT